LKSKYINAIPTVSIGMIVHQYTEGLLSATLLTSQQSDWGEEDPNALEEEGQGLVGDGGAPGRRRVGQRRGPCMPSARDQWR
jgi:hypothetical protein